MDGDAISPAGEVEDEEVVSSVTVAAGNVSGNETGYNYSEDDVIRSGGLIGLSTSGW